MNNEPCQIHDLTAQKVEAFSMWGATPAGSPRCSSRETPLSTAGGGLLAELVIPCDSRVILSSLTHQPSGSCEHQDDQANSRNSKDQEDHHCPLPFLPAGAGLPLRHEWNMESIWPQSPVHSVRHRTYAAFFSTNLCAPTNRDRCGFARIRLPRDRATFTGAHLQSLPWRPSVRWSIELTGPGMGRSCVQSFLAGCAFRGFDRVPRPHGKGRAARLPRA